MWAAGEGQVEVAKLLIEKGADIEAKDIEESARRLQHAAREASNSPTTRAKRQVGRRAFKICLSTKMSAK